MKNSSDEEMKPRKKARTSSSNHNRDDDAEEHANAPAPALRDPHRAAAVAQAEDNTITPPFTWATDRRAMVHNKNYLLEHNIVIITGTMECTKCKNTFEMNLSLENKLDHVSNYIRNAKESMHGMAPYDWLKPALQTCQHCGKEKCSKPMLKDTKKRDINWLFLFLSEWLGFCTLDQLEYLLRHNNLPSYRHKDRALYSAYICLCKQLLPDD